MFFPGQYLQGGPLPSSHGSHNSTYFGVKSPPAKSIDFRPFIEVISVPYGSKYLLRRYKLPPKFYPKCIQSSGSLDPFFLITGSLRPTGSYIWKGLQPGHNSFGCQPKNRGFYPPNHPSVIGFSLIFTIHFGGFPPIFGNHPFLSS